ncbi:MAG: carbamoyltransferase [Opitutales bacterium]
MNILGLHGGFTINQHGAGTAIISDGKLVVHMEEERFNRVKDSRGMLPNYGLRAALDYAELQPADIDIVVVPGITYTKQKERFAKYLSDYFSIRAPITVVNHQYAHLAGALSASPFKEALVVSLDGSGDNLCGMVGVFSGGKLEVKEDFPRAQSLGSFYTLMTTYLGFEDGDEYKVMGLSALGSPKYDLSFLLDWEGEKWNFRNSYLRKDPPILSVFESKQGDGLEDQIGIPARSQMEPLGDVHADLAASAQLTFETVLLKLMAKLSERYQWKGPLVFTGGCSLNCVANGRLIEEGPFEEVFIPSHAPDRGLPIGCAFAGAIDLGIPFEREPTPYLGRSFSDESIVKELDSNKLEYTRVECLAEAAAEDLVDGKILGWFQGRSESGARALGNRSILADPRSEEMKDRVNASIKYREAFRPFAPVVALEDADSYFEMNGQVAPYMNQTFKVRSGTQERIPAVVHSNNRVRAQTVSSGTNETLYALLGAFKKLSGESVLLNTSFNLKGQPIVDSPRDALMTFHGCGMDVLYLGHYRVSKKN